MSKTTIVIAGLSVVIVAGFAWWSMKERPGKSIPGATLAPEARQAMSARRTVDRLYDAEPQKAEAAYKQFIQENKTSSVPEVQDEVGHARLRLGYLAAKRNDFVTARTTFLETKKEYKGTGSVGSDFGGIPDQAAYQAAVCLMASDKKEEAYASFKKFIAEHRLSPLAHAAHRRLNLLKPDNQEAHNALLQSAVTSQEKHIRFETSVCGPKAIAYLLDRLGKATADYKELAKVCGTTDSGTTLEGMRKGLKSQGIESYGYALNADDLREISVPSLALKEDHYLVILEVGPKKLRVYDPRFKREEDLAIPKDGQTTLPVLTLAPMALEAK